MPSAATKRWRFMGCVSSLAQPRDDGACPEELFFKTRRAWRIAGIAHRFKRGVDLAERGLSHGGISAPSGEDHQCDTLAAKTFGPGERVPLAGHFLQRFAMSGDSLFQLGGPALALPE